MKKALNLTLLAVVAWTAWGQNDRSRYRSAVFDRKSYLESKIESALWRAGRWSFDPSFGVRETGYDSNVLSESDLQKVDDYQAAPFVGINAVYRASGIWAWEADTKLSYNWFKELDYLNDIDLDASSKIHFMLRRAYASISYSQRESIARPNSEIDQRATNQNQSAGLDLSVQISPKVTVNFEARHTEFEFTESSDTSLVSLNHQGDRATLGLFWHKSKRFWPHFELRYEEKDFRDDPDPYTNRATTLMVGVRNELGERFHTDLKLGVVDFDFDYLENDALDSSHQALRVDAFGDYKITRRFSMDFSLSQTPVVSVFQGFDYYRSSQVSFSSKYRFTKRMSVGPLITVGQNKYEPNAISAERRKDDRLLGGLTFDVALRDPMTLSMTFGWSERTSNLEDQNDEGFTVLMRFVYGK